MMPYLKLPLVFIVLLFMAGCTRLPSESAAVGLTGDGVPPTKTALTWKDVLENNIVMQRFDYSCGAASMATLLQYYFEDPVSEDEILREMTETLDEKELEKRRKEGFSLLDLKQYAERRGYQAIGVRLDVKALKQLKGPVLVFLELPRSDHFAVFRGVREDRVYVADPSRGNVRMPIYQFVEEWPSGIALVVVKDGNDLPSEYPLALEYNESFRLELRSVRRALYQL
jgi:predicted double-glycine peptidase